MDLRATVIPPDGEPLRVWIFAWDDLGADLAVEPGPGPCPHHVGLLEIGGPLGSFRAEIRLEPLAGGDLRALWVSPAALRLRLPGRLREALDRVTARRGRLPVLRAGADSAAPPLAMYDLDTTGARVLNPGWPTGASVALFVEIPDGAPGLAVRAEVKAVVPTLDGRGAAVLHFVESSAVDRMADRLAAWLQARRTRQSAA